MVRLLFLVSILSFVIITQVHTRKLELEPRIWGGETAKRHQFPYLIGIWINLDNKFAKTCGGSLISRRFVLTAAHCVDFNLLPIAPNLPKRIILVFRMHENFDMFSGKSNQFLEAVYQPDVIIHPLFNSSTLLNDIALVKLPSEIPPNVPFVDVVSLPPKDLVLPVGQNITSVGWGGTGNVNLGKDLQFMVTKVAPEQGCIAPFPDLYQGDKQICINAANKSICEGDSGSPNTITTADGKTYVVGISACPADSNSACENDVPQILTRISYYVPWIHNHTGIPIPT